MSHFTVLVTNTQDSDIDKQLAPYNEDVYEGDEYAKFHIECHTGDEHEYVKNSIKDWLNHLQKVSDPAQARGDDKEWQKRLNYVKERIMEEVDSMQLGPKKLHTKIREGSDYDEDEDGNIGYWHNPNAQWDWYMVGGRWDKGLILKDGKGANTCKKKDLDVEKTKDCIFAVVHNGEWYEKAKMGWWGITHDEKDEDVWQKQIIDILDSLADDAELTLVDCHIQCYNKSIIVFNNSESVGGKEMTLEN